MSMLSTVCSKIKYCISHPLFFLLVLAVTAGCSDQSDTNSESLKNTAQAISDFEDSAAASASADTVLSDSMDFTALSVDEIMQRMSLREKIGQLFFVRARGYFQNENSSEYLALEKKIREYEVGGITFFKGTIYGQAVLTNKLQQKSKLPLWISQDMEFGAAMRIEGTTRITPAMGIGASGDPNNAWQAGQITAREAKAVGVNQIFAPDLDVNNNPRNPVINVRSFSGDPQIVAEYGGRFIEGASAEGIISTGKHFPGHGDTGTDSHYALPVINADYARLDSVELLPFKAAISKNVPSIMSAHINFPKISPNSKRPSTLDPDILKRILVDSLGFKGMIVTDGLEMRGISRYYSAGKAVILALKAGADIMLLSPNELKAIDEVSRAVKNGKLSEQRIDQSVRKLLYWKKGAGLFENDQVDINNLSKTVHSVKNQFLADEIARESLTLLRNDHNIIPIMARRFPRVLILSVSNDNSGETGSELVSKIRKYHPAVRFEVFDRRSSSEEQRHIMRDAQWADLIIIGSYIGINSRSKQQFSNRQLSLLKRLPPKTPKVMLAFDNPYAVQDMPNTEVQLEAWDDSDQQVDNVAPALFGQSAITGRLPINIPGMYKIGHGLKQPRAAQCFDAPAAGGLSPDSLKKVQKIMQKAVRNSQFPGGVLGVVRNGVLAYCNATGYHTYDKKEPVAANDVYDLASLTKIVATTTSVMQLVDEGKLSLNDPVSEFIPEFKTESKSGITIRNLLLHNSGLPAFRVYVDKLKSREAILEAIKNEPLINEPGTKYVYSDLGFILLGEIVEEVSGLRIDKYARQNIYEPMGMESTYFNPKSIGPWLSDLIPPTEIDETFRHKTMKAEVHDERAWYMDGVAGHAGLFSNVQNLSKFAEMLLNKGTYAGKQYISPETVQLFTKKQSDLNNRGYGFDRKSPQGFSTAGTLAGNRSFGHTGFTGTSIWIDPDKDIAIILLTNRVYPKRTYGKNISKVRAAVADAVISSIIDEPNED